MASEKSWVGRRGTSATAMVGVDGGPQFWRRALAREYRRRLRNVGDGVVGDGVVGDGVGDVGD